MCSPTTLTFSVLVLVIGRRPLRTGFWFYLGALGATLGIGVVAALVLGDAAASQTPSTPKTWGAVLDLILGALLIVFVVRVLRPPPHEARAAANVAPMGKEAPSPVLAVLGAGA